MRVIQAATRVSNARTGKPLAVMNAVDAIENDVYQVEFGE